MFLDEKYTAMPWDKIDNVVFDIGNVLMEYNPPRYARLLFTEDERLQREMVSIVHESPYWVRLDEGTLTRQEAIIYMTRERPELRPQAQLLLDNFVRISRPMQEGCEAVEQCRAMGKKLYLLSNYHNQAFEELRKVLPIVDTFDGEIISARVKQLKPHDDIYQTLLKTYELNPTRTVFIDDTTANAEGAVRNGMEAICYRVPGQLNRFFGKEMCNP